MKRILLLTLIMSWLQSFGQQKDIIRVYFLGGQSNMGGYGKNEDVSSQLKEPIKNVWIFQGNPVADNQLQGGLGIWDQLKPGHGAGFSSNGTTNNLSDRFGLELSFGNRMQKLYPNDKIAIIKYARGGTSIDSLAAGRNGSWEESYKGGNGINQYDNFLKTVRAAFNTKDIDLNGVEDYIVPSGIIWMQGESDAYYTEEIASRYYKNLEKLMDLICASLHSDDLPIVIGKISDSGKDTDGKRWDHCELVQYAQEKYARVNSNVSIVRETVNYKYSDFSHYDSEGYIDLGKIMAEEIFRLTKSQ